MSFSLRSIWRSLVVASAAVGLGACGFEAPTAPNASVVTDAPAPGLLRDLLQKKPLRREQALRRDVTVAAVIGRAGGRIELPGQGFTLVVPRGAVKKDTRFEVTAVKGDLVAYEFEPHGTTFNVPLVATQELDGTQVQLRILPSLTAGYFTDRNELLNRDGTLNLLELINGITLPLTREFTWKIEHFSGYIVAY